MSRIVWDATGSRYFETGLSKGVIYPVSNGVYGEGVAWNGLTSLSESPSGAELTDLYADDIKYASLRSAETFGATIEAYTYPEEFALLDGSASLADGVMIGQQGRGTFGMTYVTKVGSDTSPDPTAYKLHLIYGASVSPSEKAYQTINDSPEAITFSWELSTTPVNVTGHKATSTIVIDSTKADPTKLAALEDILYGTNGSGGTEGTAPRLPLPDEIATLMG